MIMAINDKRLSPRLQAMRYLTIRTPQEISLFRAQAVTDVIRSSPGLSRGEQLALGLKLTFDRLPITIGDDERIVGAPTEKFKGAILYPELKSDFLIKELDNFGDRELERFAISEAEKRQLREDVLTFWDGNSAFEAMLSAQSDQALFGMRNLFFVINNDFSGSNHLAHIDYGRVLELGFTGIIAKARDTLERLPLGSHEAGAKAAFYRSVILSGEAVIDFAARYAELALDLAGKAESAARARELREIASIAAHVPAQPARTFHEAVQSLWFAVLALMQLDGAMEVPLGRLDQLLHPYYQRDLEEGQLTQPEAVELLAELFIKVNRITYLREYAATKVIDGNPIRYTVTIGGVAQTGADAVSPLSHRILDAFEMVGLTNPNMAVRLHPNSAKPFRERVIQMMTNGSNLIQVFNDEVMIAGFGQVGFAAASARDYIITGCVQPLPAGTYGPTCSSFINGPKVLELVLNGGKPILSLTGEEEDLPVPTYGSFDELWKAFKQQLRSVTEDALAGLRVVGEVQERLLPNPILSALSDGTLESGRDVKSGGARHNATGVNLIGLGTLADSLAALKDVVFDRKTNALAEVIEWVKADFEGYEAQRQMLLNHPPKYGNGDFRADEIAGAIVDSLALIVSEHRPYRGGIYTVGLHSETHHVIQGVVDAASPDGRRAGEMLSPGCGPTSGMDQQGPTASLRSMLAVNYTNVVGGASANMRFSPSLLQSRSQVEQLGAMLDAFFELGGQHLQVNVVDVATLRDAQLHPERYRDLIVRVTGYSARFVELTPATQEEIIRRSEMQVCG